MKPFFPALTLAALAFSSTAVASELSEIIHNQSTLAIVTPYYECMKSGISKYAKKSSNTQDAIDASKAACSSQRSEMIRNTSNVLVMDMPRDMADKDAREWVDEIEEKLRPYYVKAVLDKK